MTEFTPLRAKGVVDADGNLDCWDTNPYEICTMHVAALNEKDPGAMWRVVDLFARDEAAFREPANVCDEIEALRDVLHRMLEAPTTQISATWKDAVRQALVLGPNVLSGAPLPECTPPQR